MAEFTENTFESYLARKLANPEFRRLYESDREVLAVGIEIARLRHEAGLSQSQLAQRAGMHKQNVARLERPDYRGYTLDTLQRVANALGKQLRISFTAAPSGYGDRG